MHTSIKRFIAGASLAGAIGIGGAAVAAAQGTGAPRVNVPAATDPGGATTDSTPAPADEAPTPGRGGHGGSGSSENCPNMGGASDTPSSTTPSSAQNTET